MNTKAASSWRPAYPERHVKFRSKSGGCLAFILLIPLGFAAGFVWALALSPRDVSSWFGLGLSTLILGGCCYGAFVDTRIIRIIPMYEKHLAGVETFLIGHALARNWGHLDRLATAQGVRPLSDFGFNDPLEGETVIWHSAAEVLPTVRTLIAEVAKPPVVVDTPDAVTGELKRWEHAFALAQAQNIRLALLVEIGDSTSGQVWEIRKGHI